MGKNLGAYGDGGMVTTSDPTVVERTSWLRNYGECAKYEHVMKGVNWNEERLRHASAYAAALEGVGDLVLQERSESSTHVYHLFIVETTQRDPLRRYLTERGSRPESLETRRVTGGLPERQASASAELGLYPECE